MSAQTLRNWRRQDQLDRNERADGVTSDDREELARLRRKNVRLRQERDLLKRAAAFFATENGSGELLPDRPGGEGPNPRFRGLRAAGCVDVGLFAWARVPIDRPAGGGGPARRPRVPTKHTGAGSREPGAVGV